MNSMTTIIIFSIMSVMCLAGAILLLLKWIKIKDEPRYEYYSDDGLKWYKKFWRENRANFTMTFCLLCAAGTIFSIVIIFV